MTGISKWFVMTVLLADGIAFSAAYAQPPSGAAQTANSSGTGAPSRYLPDRFAGRAGAYYKYVWGVDSLRVRSAESGEIILFAWRVLDPGLAKMLNDKKAVPALIDPQAGVSLVVPTVENAGMLRQSAPPEAGKSYWMAFSNKGHLVKRGDRVDVVIGQFQAIGLFVD
jgi:hypothetical protein